jgi:hypothetical protein
MLCGCFLVLAHLDAPRPINVMPNLKCWKLLARVAAYVSLRSKPLWQENSTTETRRHGEQQRPLFTVLAQKSKGFCLKEPVLLGPELLRRILFGPAIAGRVVVHLSLRSKPLWQENPTTETRRHGEQPRPVFTVLA